MRGAGCTWNDILDRDIDAKVARTATRPLAIGRLRLRHAIVFLVLLLTLSALILLALNDFTKLLAVSSLALVALYPLMKRITYWPQAFLGLTFNWGVLLGYATITDALDPAVLVLYAGAFFWTLGYDTIYAHQDKEDDAMVGVKSTALKFGRRSAKPQRLLLACRHSGVGRATGCAPRRQRSPRESQGTSVDSQGIRPIFLHSLSLS